MDKYYHFTSCKNFYNIAKEGLKPQTGMRCQSINDPGNGVFLSKGIENIIAMYASMYNYYLKILGSEGNKEIETCKNNIECLESQKKYSWNQQYIESNLNYSYSRLNMFLNIQNGDFYNYLDGPGYLLSVSGLDINDMFPENCCYNGIIPPSNIKLVYLKNPYDDNCRFSREDIILYFLYHIPIDDILNNISNDYKDFVVKLYNDWYKNNPLLFNPNEYCLVDESISCYNIYSQKEKTLVKY